MDPTVINVKVERSIESQLKYSLWVAN